MPTRDSGNPVDYDHLITLADTLLERARTGQFPTGVLSAIAPAITETAAVAGFDYIIVNQEHSVISGGNPLLTEHLRCASVANLPTFVKLPMFSSIVARDALDLGAVGLQVPFVKSAAMLHEVFAACRFPPYGHRGMCIAPRATFWGAPAPGDVTQIRKFIEFSNNHLIIVAMVENEEGLANLDEILAVPELKVVGLGPIDLALSLGIAEEHLAGDEQAAAILGQAINQIIEKTHAAGKLIMGPSSFESHENQLASLGIDLPYYGDMNLVQHGSNEMVRRKLLARETYKKKQSAPRVVAR